MVGVKYTNIGHKGPASINKGLKTANRGPKTAKWGPKPKLQFPHLQIYTLTTDDSLHMHCLCKVTTV